MDGTQKTVAKDVIRALARQHQIAYRETALDVFGHDITPLAGDDVDLDETERLVIALQRAGDLSRRDAVHLQAEYLRQARP